MPRYPQLVPSDEPFDHYSLADGAYDINQFVTGPAGSTDSESIRVRLPLAQIGKIGEIIASKEIPEYRHPNDFIRDAVHHRLYWLANEHFPKHRTSLLDWANKDKNARRIEEMELRREALDSFRESFDMAYRNRHVTTCTEILGDAENRLDKDDSGDNTFTDELRSLVGRMREDIGRLER